MNASKTQIQIVAGLLLVLIFYGGYKYGQSQQELPAAAQESNSVIVEAEEINDEEIQSEQEIQLIYVHVSGAVENPGLYEIEAGSRVNVAVEQAIPKPEAELHALNLAAIVQDGSKIIVPEQGDENIEILQVNHSNASSSGGLVNLNHASAQELADKLPGIGPVLADRIVTYREQNGNFNSVDQLTQVSGIGAKTLDNIKDLVSVY
ncbi:competence protein ComEA [Desulfitispora alkaliphila]|uniref:helix-hairpin-helix domain-containing protein n=1 Tax=Desulfitispora alkaliphila TaxID=622674 RepID=UPI003D22D189